MARSAENRKMVGKLAVVAVGMFAFGYALIPLYKHICELTGINILAVGEKQGPGGSTAAANTQVDRTRTITVEFDANARGPWRFKPAQASISMPEALPLTYVGKRNCRVSTTVRRARSYKRMVAPLPRS